MDLAVILVPRRILCKLLLQFKRSEGCFVSNSKSNGPWTTDNGQIVNSTSARRTAASTHAKILIADPLNERGASILKEGGLVTDTRPGLNEEQICQIIGDYEGLIVRSATTVTPKIIAAGKK